MRDRTRMRSRSFRSDNRKSKIQNLKWMGLAITYLVTVVSASFSAEVPKWKEEWQRIVEAAKKEGQISLYNKQKISHPDIIAAFNKEFPFIKVLSATGHAPDLMARIVTERRADRYLANVITNGPNGPHMLYLDKALNPITP